MIVGILQYARENRRDIFHPICFVSSEIESVDVKRMISTLHENMNGKSRLVDLMHWAVSGLGY